MHLEGSPQSGRARVVEASAQLIDDGVGPAAFDDASEDASEAAGGEIRREVLQGGDEVGAQVAGRFRVVRFVADPVDGFANEIQARGPVRVDGAPGVTGLAGDLCVSHLFPPIGKKDLRRGRDDIPPCTRNPRVCELGSGLHGTQPRQKWTDVVLIDNMSNTDSDVHPGGVCALALPTGSYATRAAFAFRGGSLFDVRQFAATAVLVRHPSGDLLIDAGFGRDFERHLAILPAFRRSAHTLGVPVIDQLVDAGYDITRLTRILLTHSHWDHVSGIADLDVPVLITEDEITYADHAKDDRVFNEVSRDRRLITYTFDDGPFEGFPVSHDHYGDGSVVIVPAAGHTSGSVIVFVRTSNGARYALIGDLAWQLEGVQRNVDRPWLMRRLADSDPGRVREDLARISALANHYHVIPAHDDRAFRTMPLLSAEALR